MCIIYRAARMEFFQTYGEWLVMLTVITLTTEIGKSPIDKATVTMISYHNHT